MSRDLNPQDPKQEAENTLGQRFGAYTLLAKIGSGGMAEVFRAVAHGMEGFQRTFVLKRIRADHGASASFVEMFINEARISALLDHENIVQIYEFGEIEGCYFLTMEHLRGRDLSTILRKLYSRQLYLDPAIVAFTGLQVARGLHYAHTLSLDGKPLNIVHRDVTPSNIMLLRSGGVKLLDFGIAKARAEFQRGENTETGVCKGKLPYLAPEQVQGQRLDPRTDVYALGVVLWEALTGRRLFLGRNDYETMQNVLERPIPPPSMLRPETPTALDYVVIRALERDPRRRYPDARAMANELEDVVHDLGYRSETIPTMLDDLFGWEENSVTITPPHLPVVDINALGSWSAEVKGRPAAPALQAATRPAPGLLGRARIRIQALLGGRRKRLLMVAATASLSLAALLWSGLAKPSVAEAPRPTEVAALPGP